MIQCYGKWDDYNSFAGVARAIINELVKKRYDVTIFGVDSKFPKYVDVRADVGLRMSAPIGVYIGYPEPSIGYLHGHSVKVLVTVCETDKIPSSWVEACNLTDLVVVPSQWCYEAFKKSGVTKP